MQFPLKKKKKTFLGNWKPFILLVGIQNGRASMENSMEVRLIIKIDPAIPLLGIYPKEVK